MSATTTPLAKAITTLEGQLSVAATVAIGVAGSPVLHALNPKVAAVAIVVNNVALLVQRGVIKVKASKFVNDVANSKSPLKTLISDVEAASGGPVTEEPAAPAPAAPAQP